MTSPSSQVDSVFTFCCRKSLLFLPLKKILINGKKGARRFVKSTLVPPIISNNSGSDISCPYTFIHLFIWTAWKAFICNVKISFITVPFPLVTVALTFLGFAPSSCPYGTADVVERRVGPSLRLFVLVGVGGGGRPRP